MKNLKYIIYFTIVSLFLTNCEKESTITNTNSTLSELEQKQEKHQLKLKLLKERPITKSSNLSSREVFSYKNQLCGQLIEEEHFFIESYSYPDQWDYYYFEGVEGDVISIYVPRRTVGMDPAMTLFAGITDNSNGLDAFGESENEDLEFLIFADDEVEHDYDDDGDCYDDPQILNFELPYTGFYTLAVYDAAGCGLPSLYEIIITGISCDTDNDGVLNEDDPFPNSDMREKIEFDEIDFDIDNVFSDDGTTMMDQLNDLVSEIEEQYNGENWDELHRQFTRGISKITYGWRKDRLISRRQRSELSSAAWRSNIPHVYID